MDEAWLIRVHHKHHLSWFYCSLNCTNRLETVMVTASSNLPLPIMMCGRSGVLTCGKFFLLEAIFNFVQSYVRTTFSKVCIYSLRKPDDKRLWSIIIKFIIGSIFWFWVPLSLPHAGCSLWSDLVDCCKYKQLFYFKITCFSHQPNL